MYFGSRGVAYLGQAEKAHVCKGVEQSSESMVAEIHGYNQHNFFWKPDPTLSYERDSRAPACK